MIKYAICATPRSGSNLLCDLLEGTRCLGHPRELLNSASMMRPFAERHGLMTADGTVHLERYLAALVERHSTKNGVFGMKLFTSQLHQYLESKIISDFLSDCSFIYLTRSDIVAQAVSVHIARTTKEWTSVVSELNATLDGSTPNSDTVFDVSSIERALESTARQNAAWLEFFSVNGRTFLPVTYEEIIRDAQRTCVSICDFLGVRVDHRFEVDKARFKSQHSALNVEFKALFAERSRWCLPSWNPVSDFDAPARNASD